MGKKGGGGGGGQKKEQAPQPESVVTLLKPSLDGITQCIYKLNLATTATANAPGQNTRGKRGRDGAPDAAGGALGSSEEVDELYSVLTDHLTSLGEILETYQRALLPCAAVIVSHILPILSRHRAPAEAWRCAASCATLFGSAAVPLLRSVVEHLVSDIQNPAKLQGRKIDGAVGPAVLADNNTAAGPSTQANAANSAAANPQPPASCSILLHPIVLDVEKLNSFIELLYGSLEAACATSHASSAALGGAGEDSTFSATVAGVVVRLLVSWRLCPLSFSLSTCSGQADEQQHPSDFERNDLIAEALADLLTSVVTLARPLLPEVLSEAHMLITSTRPYSTKTKAAISRLRATIRAVQHPTAIPIAISPLTPSLPSYATATSTSASSVAVAGGEAAEQGTSGAAVEQGRTSATKFGTSSNSAAASLLSSFLAPPPAPAASGAAEAPAANSSAVTAAVQQAKTEGTKPVASTTASAPTPSQQGAETKRAPVVSDDIPDIVDSDED